MTRRHRRKQELRAYIARIHKRSERVQEDVYWMVYRDQAARAAQITFEAREGTPWWVYRILECADGPDVGPHLKAVS